MASRKTLMSAFAPAKEVDEPSRFAGREQQVRDLTDALQMDGSVPLIYGHRGLGKSSLALQMARIAMGDTELLHHFSADHLALVEADRFLVLQVTCTDSTYDVYGLLQLLINAAESVEFVTAKDGSGAKQLVDRTSRKKLTLKVVELESTKRYQNEASRLSYQDLGLEEKLVQLCEILTDAYGQPVLFIIDELDRMAETHGLASFLKANSNDHLKFLLVGIANNEAELLADHESLERKLYPVHVPTMSKTDLRQIVYQVNDYLRRNDIDVTFTSEAIHRLADFAAGFPWFVHVLGQSALIAVHDAGTDCEVHEIDIDIAAQQVGQNQFAQRFSDLYQRAVRDSYARETVLRMFAEWDQVDIPTREIYRQINSNFSFTNPSVYKGHLTTGKYGSVLTTPAFQSHGLVRFTNEMFKAYVRLRPSIYEGIDERVRDAWS